MSIRSFGDDIYLPPDDLPRIANANQKQIDEALVKAGDSTLSRPNKRLIKHLEVLEDPTAAKDQKLCAAFLAACAGEEDPMRRPRTKKLSSSTNKKGARESISSCLAGTSEWKGDCPKGSAL